MKKKLFCLLALTALSIVGCGQKPTENPTIMPTVDPTSEKPTTVEPTTEEPTSEVPTTEEPTSEVPTTEEPQPTDPIVEQNPLEIYILEMCGIYGDSIYLKQGDVDVLIDAGWDTDGEYVRDFVDTHCEDGTLDLLVATHPHGDHVGGMSLALSNVENVANIIDYGMFATAPSGGENGLGDYERLKKEYIEDGAKYTAAYNAVNGGQKVLSFNEDFSVEVMNTGNYYTDGVASTADPNGHSVSLLFKYKDFTFLTQGDATTDEEEGLLKNEEMPEVTMYKASHHGSHGSNSQAFLNKINPKEVVISASRALSYQNRTNKEVNKLATSGHPADEAIGRIYNTPNIKENKNVYWNMYAGTMKFTTEGANEAVALEGFGPERLGYYEQINGEYVKVTGEENLRFHETKVFKARGYDKYLNQSDSPIDPDPVPPSGEYADMEYSLHSEYLAAADGTTLKVKGVVTSSNGKNTAFMQDGTEGYYIYDKTLVPNLVVGKTYTLVGSKKIYNGIHEISDVVYNVEETNACSVEAIDVTSLDFTSTTVMQPYHASIVSFKDLAIVDIPDLSSYTRTSYTISTKLDEKSIKVNVDKSYLGEEVYNQTLTDFASLLIGQTISFEAIISVKQSSTELTLVNPEKLTAGTVSNEAVLDNAINSVVIDGTIKNGVNSIKLPTSVEGSDVTLSWASSDESVISTTGAVVAKDADTIVTLTLTVSLNGESKTAEYTVCVIGKGTNAVLAYTEDFTHANSDASGSYGGSGIKGGYADGVATFHEGYTWTFNSALHGSLANDKPYVTDPDETWCARIKPTSVNENAGIYTNFSFENLEYVDFYYAAYGQNVGSILTVYYSIDGGTTWVATEQTFVTGLEATYARVYINQTEACMIKFAFENDKTGATSNIDYVQFYVSAE